ncbi:MAG: cobalamin biosynthesis protein CobW [Actinobacteria bacterium]|nr:cobalamin biosynthesis protein CobW [Actinomycetota bacterium]
MDATIAIMGVCAPERLAYAERTATATGRALHLARRTNHGTAHTLPRPRPRTDDGRIVVDLGTDVDLVHTLLSHGGVAAEAVCVVDARHMIGDLLEDAALVASARPGDPRGDVGARARQAATALELATRIVWVNWEQVPTAALAVQMALASHLNPAAIVRLSLDPLRDLASPAVRDGESEVLERAGWVRALNDEHDPYMSDRRVRTLRYDQVRPFHPGRLMAALDRLDEGAAGRLVRSAGFCRLATRPGILARWEQVGSAMWIEPIGADDGRMGLGQEIALTGLDLSPAVLGRLLDDAALTDDEIAAGPAAWAHYEDPLPAWSVVGSSLPDATD